MSSDFRKSDYGIHVRYRNQMKRKVFLSLVAVALFFAFTLFPAPVLRLMISSSSDYLAALSKTLGSVSIAMLASSVLFASDSAFRGDNHTARWVRSMYPSIAAEESLGCSRREATTLWFMYFDTWGLPASPHHDLVAITYAATYQGRWMFYLRWTLAIFAVQGVFAFAINHFVFDVYTVGADANARLVLHSTVLASFFLALFAVWRTNRIGTNRIGLKRAPVGCWERVAQLMAMSQVHFERDVLATSDSLDAGLDRVEEIKRELLQKNCS